MDKTKFTINPQLDSEGFLDTAAECRGCDGNEPCPRSGHCPRYNSPLRFYNQQTITVVANPPGWNEPGMQPINWAEPVDWDMALANAHLDGLKL